MGAPGPIPAQSVENSNVGTGTAPASPLESVRTRVSYVAMSCLLVWHTFAMTIASLPEGVISQHARTIFEPYVTLFRLDNHWGFFAPNVGSGYQFRYVVEDAAGTRHTFIPADKLSHLHPASIWFKDRYRTIISDPDVFGGSAVASFCQEHAPLKPVSITLLEVEQKDFWPEHQLSGKTPLDPEFVNVRTVRIAPCPAA